MELPTPDQQTTLYGLLTFIGGGLMAIARALFKLLHHYIESAKQEGIQKGMILAKLEHVEVDIKLLKENIDKIALLYLKTPRAIATKQVEDAKRQLQQQNEKPSD